METIEKLSSKFGLQIRIVLAASKVSILLDIPIEKLCENFYGEYDSHEEFAQDYYNNLGYDLDLDMWPLDCINWGDAADSLMYMDYHEQDGFYFCII